MFTKVTGVDSFNKNLSEQQELNDQGYPIFQALEEKLRQTVLQIKRDKEWKPEDARIRMFDKMYQIVGGLLMNLIAHKRLFTWDGFYLAYAKEGLVLESLEDIPVNELAIHADNAAKFLQNGIASYVHLLYSTVESSLRIFAREILPGEFGNATDEFKRLYDSMIKNHCFKGSHQQNKDKQNRYMKLLNLFAMVRNTIHNNGVFFNEEPESSIRWGGQTFDFMWAQPVALTWDHFKVLTEGVIETMDAIVRSDFVSVPPLVKDPTPTVTTYNIMQQK